MNSKIYAYILLILFSTASLKADIFYYPSEYDAVYNEKVALELELKSIRGRFRNDKTKLLSKIKLLEGKIKYLNERIVIIQKNRATDKKASDKEIAALKKRIGILKSRSSKRERNLINNAQKVEADYKKQLNALKKQMEAQELAALKKLEALKEKCRKKTEKLEGRITDLTEEINRLKKLNKNQSSHIRRLADQTKSIEDKLKKEIADGKIRVKRYHNRLVIKIDDRISFPSGSAKLKTDIMPAIKKIAEIVSKYPANKIIVEGHTDNIPIRTRRFKDNWDLSSARALAVLRELLKNKDLKRANFSAAGHGEFQPEMPNDTPENRSLNRRVDIVVITR